jgi:hypothetical protein
MQRFHVGASLLRLTQLGIMQVNDFPLRAMSRPQARRIVTRVAGGVIISLDFREQRGVALKRKRTFSVVRVTINRQSRPRAEL